MNSEGKTNKSVGHPTAFKEEYCELAENYCLLGATDVKLAEFFDVCEATINNWKKAHPLFLESIKKGKVIADANVVKSLYKKATGYSHLDTKFATFEGQITDEKEYVKHYAPDTTAAIFWLKNRQKDLWRDRHEVSHDSKTELFISDKAQEEIVKARGAIEGMEAPE